LGAALSLSVLLHAWLLSHAAPPRPVESERVSLTVRLGGTPRGELEALRALERGNAAVRMDETPGHETLPPRARARQGGASPRATPEKSAGPIPREAGEPSRKPYVSLQLTSFPEDAPEGPAGYVPQGNLDRAPQLLVPIVANYPHTALSAGRSGHVIADLLLSKEGKVVWVSPWQVEGPEFVPPALEALRRARFRPTEYSGQAVAARLFYVVLFYLE
jgi:hypothetical protein